MNNELKLTYQELTDKFFPIYFYRKHLDIACRDLLGLDLSPHHAKTLRDWGNNKPINVLLASRGMGKSILLGIFFVLMAILYPKLKLMIVAGTGFRGSKALLMECERVILGFLGGQRKVEYAKYSLVNKAKPITKDPSYWRMEFTNGSMIMAIPLGITSEGSVLKGLRAHILGLDEAYLIPHKLYQVVLEPFQNVMYEPHKPPEEQVVKNMLISVSTIDYTHRDFWKQFEYYKAILESEKDENEVETVNTDIAVKEEIKKKDISLFEFNMEDSFYVNENKKRKMLWGLDLDRIIKKKNLPTTDIELWNAENKNIPLDVTGGYFSFDEIDKGTKIELDKTNNIFPSVLGACNSPCILGIDHAPSKDNTAFVVIKVGPLDKQRDIEKCLVADLGNPCQMLGKGNRCSYSNYVAVLYVYEENKMELSDRIKLIYKLLNNYNLIGIAADRRGGGYEVASLLKDREYIKSTVGIEAKPIYDPKDTEIEGGIDILRMYATTQDSNLKHNSFLRGIIHNQTLLFPKPLGYRPINKDMLESAGHCETLIAQLVRIKAKAHGNSVKFEIETVDPNSGKKVSGKKDIYSALLYASALLQDKLEEKEKKKEDNPATALPQAFNLRVS